MRKKVIKAHQGMAHVPKPSASKAKGTAGTTPRRRRMIGLPQQFRGGSRRASNLPQLSKDQQQALKGFGIKAQQQGAIDPRAANYTDNFRPRKTTAPAPKAPPRVRPTKAMPEPAVIQQPKPVVRPPKIMDGDGGRGGRPVFELPNMGRGKPIQRPKPQSFRVPAVQMPKSIPKPMQPRIVNKGGYISKTKYGQVNNLKGK